MAQSLPDKIQTPEDEGDHFPTGIEWWWLYTTLTLEDGRQWDLCIQFLYQMNWSTNQWSTTDGVSYLRIQSWDRQTATYYDNLRIEKHPGPFHHEKNKINLSYFNSTYHGLYPHYSAYLQDDRNDIMLTMEFEAISRPHYFAEESVKGTVPWGTGTFQYWIMPLGHVTGILTLHGEEYPVTGIGYTEHMVADTHLIGSLFRGLGLRNLCEVGSLYASLAKWTLVENLQNGIPLLDFLHTSTGSFFGYDWIWAGFDNGWSMVLCRLSAFNIDDGPSLALLILTNGDTYWELADVTTKVTRNSYLGDRDIYLPLDFEITAEKDDMKFTMCFTSTTEITRMYIKQGVIELGNFLVAGEAKGTVSLDGYSVPLEGKGTNTPLRYIPRYIKHLSNNIDLVIPPKGLGVIFSGRNHYLHVEVILKILLKPSVDIQLQLNPSPQSPSVIQNILTRLHDIQHQYRNRK